MANYDSVWILFGAFFGGLFFLFVCYYRCCFPRRGNPLTIEAHFRATTTETDDDTSAQSRSHRPRSISRRSLEHPKELNDEEQTRQRLELIRSRLEIRTILSPLPPTPSPNSTATTEEAISSRSFHNESEQLDLEKGERHEVNQTALAQLKEMGYPTKLCKKALKAVGGQATTEWHDVTAAVDWIFEHKMDRATTVSQAPPKGVPILKYWQRNSAGGVSGRIYCSRKFEDGDIVETSRIVKGTIENGCIVSTKKKSRYYLTSNGDTTVVETNTHSADENDVEPFSRGKMEPIHSTIAQTDNSDHNRNRMEPAHSRVASAYSRVSDLIYNNTSGNMVVGSTTHSEMEATTNDNNNRVELITHSSTIEMTEKCRDYIANKSDCSKNQCTNKNRSRDDSVVNHPDEAYSAHRRISSAANSRLEACRIDEMASEITTTQQPNNNLDRSRLDSLDSGRSHASGSPRRNVHRRNSLDSGQRSTSPMRTTWYHRRNSLDSMESKGWCHHRRGSLDSAQSRWYRRDSLDSAESKGWYHQRRGSLDSAQSRWYRRDSLDSAESPHQWGCRRDSLDSAEGPLFHRRGSLDSYNNNSNTHKSRSGSMQFLYPTLTNGKIDPKSQEVCSICLEPYKVGDRVARMKKKVKPKDHNWFQDAVAQLKRQTQYQSARRNSDNCHHSNHWFHHAVSELREATENSQTVYKPTTCRHWFHEDCILGWLENNDECPLCRVDMIND